MLTTPPDAHAPLFGAFAHRALGPPTSSSLADEKRVRSFLLSTAERAYRRSRPPFGAFAHRALGPPTSSSLADEKRVRSFLLSTAERDCRRSRPGGVSRLWRVRSLPPLASRPVSESRW